MFLPIPKNLHSGYEWVKYLILLSLVLFCLNCAEKSPEKFQKNPPIKVSKNAVNINSADAAELQKIPGIGEKTAEKIIEHRTKYGSFRRPEHLMLVGGISDKRFRKMRGLIKVE